MNGAASEPVQSQIRSSACADCQRRSWLLAQLSPLLDLNCRADGRLFELLALGDGELIQALGGRRRDELRRDYASFRATPAPRSCEVAELCVHDRRYPRELTSAGICPMLHVAGGLGCFHELTRRPVVAIIGTPRASDYGRATASDLARGLATSGVTVAAALSGGVAAAAMTGALEGGGGTLTIAGGGLDMAPAAKRRALRDQALHGGCAASALACGVDGRRWGAASAERILVALATVTLVVEAHARPCELAPARVARSLGRTVAAVPGRVTAPAARGCHMLLRDGARLVEDAADALELLYEADAAAAVRPAAQPASDGLPSELEPRLRAVLERVGTGEDTPGRLAGELGDAATVLRALSELELLGLLSRGDGGRYLVRTPVKPQAVRYVGCSQMEP